MPDDVYKKLTEESCGTWASFFRSTPLIVLPSLVCRITLWKPSAIWAFGSTNRLQQIFPRVGFLQRLHDRADFAALAVELVALLAGRGVVVQEDIASFAASPPLKGVGYRLSRLSPADLRSCVSYAFNFRFQIACSVSFFAVVRASAASSNSS